MAKAKVATKVKKKPADFKRPKHKVGRKAPQAANVTSVAISSRRINMLEQSVLQDKGDAVTHRNLSLNDLLAQIGHYNAHIRQRALQGLRELVQTHASNILANVAVVLERFLPTFVDEEAIVREAAVATWKVLLPALIAGKSLTPFAKLIAVYCCSGLTHLQIGVRHDTLRAIGALLEVAPELIGVEAGLEQLGRLIENFRDLIAATQAQGIKVTNSYDLLAFKKSSSSASSGSGTAAKDSTGKGRISQKKSAAKAGALTLRFAALKVLHRLLVSIDFSPVSGATATPSSVLYSKQAARTGTVGAGSASTPTMVLYPTPVLVANNQSEQLRNAGFWQQKSRALLQPLLDLWVECLESDVETLSEEYVEHMQYIIESATVVLSANTEFMVANPESELCRVARRLQDQLLLKFPLFPEHNIVNSGDAYLSRWYGINVAIAKFACIFLKMPAKFQSNALEGRIFTFVVSAFAKYEASDELRSLGGTHVIIRSLLEVVTLLLTANAAQKCPSPSVDASGVDMEAANVKQDELLECFTRLYNKSSSKSVTFRICTSFVLEQLAILKPWPKWDLIMQWMACFGNLLGHLERAHMELGRQCLFMMISVIKQLPVEWTAKEHMQGILVNLVNFFDLAPPAAAATEDTEQVSNSKKSKPTTQFDALDAADQMEFVSLIYHLPQYPVALLRALSSCCKSDRVDFNAKSFLMDILFQRRECLDIAHLVSFLMSSVLARTQTTTTTKQQQAAANQLHLRLVQHVCHVLISMQLGVTLSQILAPSLSRQAATLETMPLVDVHTLVLLYRACVSSASSNAGSVTVDLSADMQQQVQALGLRVLLGFASPTPNAAQDATKEQELVADFMALLAVCGSVFLPLLRALLTLQEAPVSTAEELAKRMRVLQVLVRASSLNARIVHHQQDVLALLTQVEATAMAKDNEVVSRLIRQLQGDLQLVVVGTK
ncbi:Testis-expressed sequence 10 protein, partial [Globisporangium splendens]